MVLALENITRKHGAEDHIYPLSLTLAPGAINVLLGTTQAGKTSLMRLMAGLDRPSSGRVLADGRDVTGVPVRERDPPINLMPATLGASGTAQLDTGLGMPLTPGQLQKAARHKEVILGLRAHSLGLTPRHADDFAIEAEVDLAEISGSETYVHVHRGALALVAQLPGMHNLELGAPCRHPGPARPDPGRRCGRKAADLDAIR